MQLVRTGARTADRDLRADPATIPVVLRISERAFESPKSEVRRRAEVDECVLGIRNIGVADITGVVTPNFVIADDKAEVELVVQGTAVSRTVGRRGPATIRSTTTSSFDLHARLTFDEAEGFTASPVRAEVQVTSRRTRVVPAAPGLRGRIIRRAAHNRIRSSQDQITRIAQHQTRSRLSAGMDGRLSQGLSDWNKQWGDLQKALKQQPWYPEAPKLHFATAEDHLLVMVASGGEVVANPNLDELNLPPVDANSLVEVLVQANSPHAADDSEFILAWLTAMRQPLLLLVREDVIGVTASRHEPWTMFRLGSPPGDRAGR